MDIDISDRFKHREIHFRDLDPRSSDAHRAAEFLEGVDGILRLEPHGRVTLGISYDLLKTSLQEIETVLMELGLHLDTGLMHRVRRALHYYTEETFRQNCGCISGDSSVVDRVFVKRYEAIEHGCRDRRPEHWRRYL